VSGLRKGVLEFSLAVPFVGLFWGFELGGGICRVKSARERPEGSLHASDR
jgi:hypothetical protein